MIMPKTPEKPKMLNPYQQSLTKDSTQSMIEELHNEVSMHFVARARSKVTANPYVQAARGSTSSDTKIQSMVNEYI